jgi:hypothetical protein
MSNHSSCIRRRHSHLYTPEPVRLRALLFLVCAGLAWLPMVSAAAPQTIVESPEPVTSSPVAVPTPIPEVEISMR